MYYVIINWKHLKEDNEPLFWHKDNGWVGLVGCQRYAKAEMDTRANLPNDDAWWMHWSLAQLLERNFASDFHCYERPGRLLSLMQASY